MLVKYGLTDDTVMRIFQVAILPYAYAKEFCHGKAKATRRWVD